MMLASSVAEFEELREELTAGRPLTRIGFVPTMGALHAGHLSLITLAQSVCDVVVVSIFVNPLQFGPTEDYASYPRTTETDLETCRRVGVDLVFTPAVADLYPAGRHVTVSAGPLGTVFEGAARPGHFDGMLTVVLKLLHIVDPDIAVFGQKDAQQLACVRRMVLDLNIDVQIVGAPIIREPDGLALSSRNRFLTAADRRTARALSAALRAAAAQSLPECALAAADKILTTAAESGLDRDYLALVHPSTMAEVGPEHRGPATMIVAAQVGGIRLIDNIELNFAG